MKRVVIFALMLGMAFTACKSKKEVAQSPYTTDPSKQPKVFSVPAADKPAETVKEEPKIAEKQPVAMRKEQVTFTSQTDKEQNEINSFFVILGSFSQLDNARNFRETLLNQGFTPIILHSETGYYRVCVNSYQFEGEARTRVAQIRQSFPQYSDVWLLIKN
ncbi:MAG: SPOR domain-containing protein [Bacteroidales bacterium]|jgi:cell division septation protein DedD|nr:SPOR domain-containing protein [Bacteroidales bacterium]